LLISDCQAEITGVLQETEIILFLHMNALESLYGQNKNPTLFRH